MLAVAVVIFFSFLILCTMISYLILIVSAAFSLSYDILLAVMGVFCFLLYFFTDFTVFKVCLLFMFLLLMSCFLFTNVDYFYLTITLSLR